MFDYAFGALGFGVIHNAFALFDAVLEAGRPLFLPAGFVGDDPSSVMSTIRSEVGSAGVAGLFSAPAL
jgi:hypothetical protein